MEKRDTYTGRKEYFLEYAKEKLKRVPLDLPKERYEEVKQAAQEQNESINGYIKKAIEMRMLAERGSDAGQECTQDPVTDSN